MTALMIAIPALLGVAAGFVWRQRLADMGLTSWLGWVLIGAGLPVLLGQLVALGLTEMAAAAAERCEAGVAEACQTTGLFFILPLTAGLCGGLGWAASAISARLAVKQSGA